MKAGKLRHRVTIQRLALADEPEFGGQTESWVDVATVWAAIEPLFGHEKVAAHAVQSEATVKITIRYRTDVTTAMRLIFGSDVYDIHHVSPVPGRGNDMDLLCSTGLTQG